MPRFTRSMFSSSSLQTLFVHLSQTQISSFKHIVKQVRWVHNILKWNLIGVSTSKIVLEIGALVTFKANFKNTLDSINARRVQMKTKG